MEEQVVHWNQAVPPTAPLLEVQQVPEIDVQQVRELEVQQVRELEVQQVPELEVQQVLAFVSELPPADWLG